MESWAGNRMRFQPSTMRRNLERQGIQGVCMCHCKNVLAHDAILLHSTHLREAGSDTEAPHTTDRRLQLNNMPLANYWCLLNEDGMSSRARGCTLSCFSGPRFVEFQDRPTYTGVQIHQRSYTKTVSANRPRRSSGPNHPKTGGRAGTSTHHCRSQLCEVGTNKLTGVKQR